MRKIIFCLFFLVIVLTAFPQNPKENANTLFLKKLNKDSSYTELKRKVIEEFTNAKPGDWGEFVFGVDEELATQRKCIAFTFDACGGKNGNLSKLLQTGITFVRLNDFELMSDRSKMKKK